MSLARLEAECAVALEAIDKHTVEIRGSSTSFSKIASGLEGALSICAPASSERARVVMLAERARAALQRRRDALLEEAAGIEQVIADMRSKTEAGAS